MTCGSHCRSSFFCLKHILGERVKGCIKVSDYNPFLKCTNAFAAHTLSSGRGKKQCQTSFSESYLEVTARGKAG